MLKKEKNLKNISCALGDARMCLIAWLRWLGSKKLVSSSSSSNSVYNNNDNNYYYYLKQERLKKELLKMGVTTGECGVIRPTIGLNKQQILTTHQCHCCSRVLSSPTTVQPSSPINSPQTATQPAVVVQNGLHHHHQHYHHHHHNSMQQHQKQYATIQQTQQQIIHHHHKHNNGVYLDNHQHFNNNNNNNINNKCQNNNNNNGQQQDTNLLAPLKSKVKVLKKLKRKFGLGEARFYKFKFMHNVYFKQFPPFNFGFSVSA